MLLGNKKNLIFQGGSVKGIAYLGAISALRDLKYLDFDSVERVAGTSAGAMTALAMALNYSSDELIKVLSVDVQVFLDDANSRVSRKTILNIKDAVMTNPAQPNRLPLVAPGIFMDLRDNFGLFPGKEIRDWMEQLIFEKTGIRNCTFEEFRNIVEKEPQHHFKNLFVVGFNLNTKNAVTFSHEKTPKAIIADAVRISMGIPFVFSPYQYYVKNDEGNPVLAEGYENDLWIDGGIAENYPVRIFDDAEINMDTLGFYLANKEEMSMIEGKQNLCEFPLHRVDISGVLEYAKAVIESALFVNQQLVQHLRGGDNIRTIYIDTLEIGTLDFNISVEQKNALIKSGWDAALHFTKRIASKSTDSISEKDLAVGGNCEIQKTEAVTLKTSNSKPDKEVAEGISLVGSTACKYVKNDTNNSIFPSVESEFPECPIRIPEIVSPTETSKSSCAIT